jgi:hypothetical protein
LAEFEDRHYQARYNVSRCRRTYGLLQSDSQKRQSGLQAAQRELEAFARLNGTIDVGWESKFNSLYRDVLSDLERTPQDLDWPAEVPLAWAGSEQRPTANGNRTNAANRSVASEPKSEIPKTGTSGLAILLWASALVGGLMFVIVIRLGSRRRLRARDRYPTAARSPKKRNRERTPPTKTP